MTAPHPSIDPRLLAQLSTDFGALSLQLQQVGRGLSVLRAQLEVSGPNLSAAGAGTAPAAQQPGPPRTAFDAAGPASAVPAAAPTASTGAWPGSAEQPVVYGAASAPVPTPGAAASAPRWGGPTAAPGRPAPGAWAPGGRGPTPPHGPAAPPRAAWWQRDGVISRLLAVAGAGVTLIGVVMLLVLAAQAGIFGPQARVAAGAILSVALVGAGYRVFGRTGGRVGGIALAATGIAGAYLDVVAATAIYGWIQPAVGLAIALGIAGAGLGLAAVWRAQGLALIVVVGAAALSPVLTDGIGLTLIGFLIVLQLACAPVHVVRSWPYVHAARTVPVVLALLSAIALAEDGEEYRLLASAVVVAVVGIASCFVAVRRWPSEVVASVMLAASCVPLLSVGALFDRPVAVAVAAGLAAVLLGLAWWPKLLPHTRIAALVAAVPALLQACVRGTDLDALPIALLVVAAGFVAVRSKVSYFVGIGFGALAALVFLAYAGPDKFADAELAQQEMSISIVVAALLGIGVVVLAGYAAHRLAIVDIRSAEPLVLLAGAVGLYALTAATVGTGVVAAGADGFTAGHCVATIAWMLAATALLLRGLRNTRFAHVTLVAGLALAGAAVAKLFLFDLATLDGLARVAAFIAVGLLLLVAGTRYARAFAERAEPTP